MLKHVHPDSQHAEMLVRHLFCRRLRNVVEIPCCILSALQSPWLNDGKHPLQIEGGSRPLQVFVRTVDDFRVKDDAAPLFLEGNCCSRLDLLVSRVPILYLRMSCRADLKSEGQS